MLMKTVPALAALVMTQLPAIQSLAFCGRQPNPWACLEDTPTIDHTEPGPEVSLVCAPEHDHSICENQLKAMASERCQPSSLGPFGPIREELLPRCVWIGCNVKMTASFSCLK